MYGHFTSKIPSEFPARPVRSEEQLLIRPSGDAPIQLGSSSFSKYIWNPNSSTTFPVISLYLSTAVSSLRTPQDMAALAAKPSLKKAFSSQSSTRLLLQKPRAVLNALAVNLSFLNANHSFERWETLAGFEVFSYGSG